MIPVSSYRFFVCHQISKKRPQIEQMFVMTSKSLPLILVDNGFYRSEIPNISISQPLYMFLLAGGFKKLKNMLVKWDYFSDYDGF